MSKHNHDADHECVHCALLEAGMTPEEAWIQGLKNIGTTIENSGIAILGIGPGDDGTPSFTYTVGFTDIGLPEVICFGLDPMMLASFFNRYHAELLAMTKPSGPCVIADYFNMPFTVIDVDPIKAEDYLTQAIAYYEVVKEGALKPTFVQWVLPDRNGVFPWSAKHVGFNQPVLGSAPV